MTWTNHKPTPYGEIRSATCDHCGHTVHGVGRGLLNAKLGHDFVHQARARAGRE